MTAYVDASALVKLIVAEPESDATRAYLDGHATIASSRIALIEVRRAVSRLGLPESELLNGVLAALLVLELDEHVSTTAAGLRPAGLRSLDAIHLASAMELGEDLAAFVAYDTRLIEAARELGLPVVSPG